MKKTQRCLLGNQAVPILIGDGCYKKVRRMRSGKDRAGDFVFSTTKQYGGAMFLD
jgi:hypothetical protein